MIRPNLFILLDLVTLICSLDLPAQSKSKSYSRIKFETFHNPLFWTSLSAGFEPKCQKECLAIICWAVTSHELHLLQWLLTCQRWLTGKMQTGFVFLQQAGQWPVAVAVARLDSIQPRAKWVRIIRGSSPQPANFSKLWEAAPYYLIPQ